MYLEGAHDGHEDEEGESKDVEDPNAPDFPLLTVRQEALAPLAAPPTTPHPTPRRCHCSRGASIIHMAGFRCEDGRALRVSSSLGARHRLAEHSAGIDPPQLGPSHLITSSHSRPSRGVQVLLLKTGVTCRQKCTVVYSRCGRRRTSSWQPSCLCSKFTPLLQTDTVLCPLQHCTLPLQLLLPGLPADYRFSWAGAVRNLGNSILSGVAHPSFGPLKQQEF